MTTLGERIEKEMDRKGLKRKDIAEALNISTMAVGDLINNKTKKPRYLVEIADVLGVDVKWLQTGEGSPNTSLALDEEDQKSIVIDVLDVEASAGNGSTGDLVEVVSKLYYVPYQFNLYFRGMNPESIRVINIRGDSMSPTFASGDMIFVDINITTFDGDGVYVFIYKNHLYVKRLQMAGDALIVISDNSTYKEWRITEENFEQLYIHGKVKVHQSQQLNFIG
ncbi:helix-turn-helix transcriptional regulator [Mannheimia haemolytica]|uniref:XRE family transcriptional regulator n=1 Tax=Mannheimia haemolytica TaxID=75985 RepID=UPI00115DCA83|nr:helix-turn-helix transcriptional regulator [Mannheimia haemolytica]MDW1150549.1 helix-turn-helix transcriptional regulator [Mannheimia haemolytica]MDW1160707.1 helix-turn-helix transcriptional regulator [Mannheimia haemolytica]TRC51473.1 helix-turn-helix transcriptional regulator [Mannheimia haemolytica]TRC51572.1 helix-turn-helix transcriptional regulator [Mannheimia haemolytica]